MCLTRGTMSREQKKLTVLSTKNKKPILSFKYFFLSLLVLFSTIGVAACAQKTAKVKEVIPTDLIPNLTRLEPYSNILESSYAVADILAKGLYQRGVNVENPMLAASFVNIDNLKESCTFGRIVSEQISSRLAQHGYKILEMKLRQESVFIQEGEGEFLLSRELKNISSTHRSDEVLVGTYAVAEDSLFISARIVRTRDNTVLTGYDYQLLLNYVTESLLCNFENNFYPISKQ